MRGTDLLCMLCCVFFRARTRLCVQIRCSICCIDAGVVSMPPYGPWRHSAVRLLRRPSSDTIQAHVCSGKLPRVIRMPWRGPWRFLSIGLLPCTKRWCSVAWICWKRTRVPSRWHPSSRWQSVAEPKDMCVHGSCRGLRRQSRKIPSWRGSCLWPVGWYGTRCPCLFFRGQTVP